MTWDDAWRIGRGLYSIALVVALLTLAVIIARFAPLALRAVIGLSEALTLAARALLSTAATAESQARMEAKIDQIHAAVCRPTERNPPP